ncbi:MAG: hypothetical protein KGJ90_06790 [Patescibacteria group bacterium]|nr:hypothetical protein [Patescibacteria group bacterium]
MSVAFAKAKSRSVDENFGNTILICSASEAPHECDIPGCPGDLNRRKLELFNEMAETLWFAYARALQARDQDSELINKLCSVIEKTKELK